MRIYTQKWGFYYKIRMNRIDKCHNYILKISTFWHLSNSPQLETLFVLKQCQINQRIKSNKPKNCESTSFENQKQMYGSTQKRINKVNTYHYPTTTTCKRNES